MANESILWPVAAHLGLVFALYAWLTVERFLNASQGKAQYAGLLLPGGDRGRAAHVAANLNNQFQAPVFFHLLALVLWLTDMVSVIDVALAWIFVAGRLIHTLVHAFSTNVIMRGLVFSINFSALSLMWVHFLFRAL